jgi:hypothetical protein
MVKNTGDKESRHGKEKKPELYVDEQYFRHVDQIERWRQEYEYWQAAENKLTEVGKVSYAPVDYTPLLERQPFPEHPIPNFLHIMHDARIAAESRYFVPIAAHVGIMLLMLVILIAVGSKVAFGLCAVGVLVLFASFYFTIEKRRVYMKKSIAAAQAEVARKQESVRLQIEAEKKQHEHNEEERIKQVQKLLDGDLAAIFSKLDAVLPQIGFPFPLAVDVHWYDKVPMVQVWLPAKSIIPTQVCALQQSGRVNFSDKEQRAVNKQYMELCAAVLMQVMTRVYANIPTIDLMYVYGMTKEKVDIGCIMTVITTRESLEGAANAVTGLSALQKMGGQFNYDTSLDLLPVDCRDPLEWGEVERQMIRTLHVKLYKE